MAVYGFEINEWLSSYSDEKYLGCYPRDSAPNLKKGQVCIVNLMNKAPVKYY